jgi:hypothetical protein
MPMISMIEWPNRIRGKYRFSQQNMKAESEDNHKIKRRFRVNGISKER